MWQGVLESKRKQKFKEQCVEWINLCFWHILCILLSKNQLLFRAKLIRDDSKKKKKLPEIFQAEHRSCRETSWSKGSCDMELFSHSWLLLRLITIFVSQNNYYHQQNQKTNKKCLWQGSSRLNCGWELTAAEKILTLSESPQHIAHLHCLFSGLLEIGKNIIRMVALANEMKISPLCRSSSLILDELRWILKDSLDTSFSFFVFRTTPRGHSATLNSVCSSWWISGTF